MNVYHFQTLHSETFGAHLDGEQFKVNVTDKGDVHAFYDAAPNTPVSPGTNVETRTHRAQYHQRLPQSDRRSLIHSFLPSLT